MDGINLKQNWQFFVIALAQFESPQNARSSDSFGQFFSGLNIITALNFLAGLAGIVAIAGFLLAALFFLTSGGSDEKLEDALEILGSSIIFLAVMIIGIFLINHFNII